MSSYGAFAQVYDRLMVGFDYPNWADYYLKLIGRMGCEPVRLCDCACGTGSLTLEFANMGLKVTGVDISESMLSEAQKKARQRGLSVPFVRQDICKLELPRPVDAIVCGCDGVNYLLTEERLRAFFRRAHESLRAGGVLAFDVSTRYKLEQILGNGFFGEDGDEVSYLWFNEWNAERASVQMDLTFFAREADGRYRRFTETHVQRAHSFEALNAALIACGFTDAVCFGDRTFEAPSATEQRMHVAAVRI